MQALILSGTKPYFRGTKPYISGTKPYISGTKPFHSSCNMARHKLYSLMSKTKVLLLSFHHDNLIIIIFVFIEFIMGVPILNEFSKSSSSIAHDSYHIYGINPLCHSLGGQHNADYHGSWPDSQYITSIHT